MRRNYCFVSIIILLLMCVKVFNLSLCVGLEAVLSMVKDVQLFLNFALNGWIVFNVK